MCASMSLSARLSLLNKPKWTDVCHNKKTCMQEKTDGALQEPLSVLTDPVEAAEL